MRSLLFILAITICSCTNSTNNFNDKIIDDFDSAAESKMIVEYKNSVENYRKKIANLVSQTTDSTARYKINLFNETFLNCLNFTDSLKGEMDKLDQHNFKNTETINNIYLKQGIADSLFYKISATFKLAESIAKNEQDKKLINESRIRILNEPNTTQIKKQLFGFNNSMGVSMILYGFEVELFQMADILLNSINI